MDKPLSLFTKLVLIGAGGLAVVAGPILYLFPYNTGSYFAWEIANPLTPIFMGASYLAGIGNLMAVRADRWSLARVQLPAILTFTLTMLVATLLHIPIFNWSHPIAWAWLAVYIVSPVAAAIVFIQGERGFQAPVFESQPLPASFSLVMRTLGGIYGLLGLALFLAPGSFASAWAWTLTPLTSRVLGGWFLSSTALQWMLSQQTTLHTARVGLLATVVVTGLLLVGAVFYFSVLTGPMIAVFGYLALNVVLGGFAVYSWLSARK